MKNTDHSSTADHNQTADHWRAANHGKTADHMRATDHNRATNHGKTADHMRATDHNRATNHGSTTDHLRATDHNLVIHPQEQVPCQQVHRLPETVYNERVDDIASLRDLPDTGHKEVASDTTARPEPTHQTCPGPTPKPDTKRRRRVF